jgi:hypothetical protein
LGLCALEAGSDDAEMLARSRRTGYDSASEASSIEPVELGLCALKAAADGEIIVRWRTPGEGLRTPETSTCAAAAVVIRLQMKRSNPITFIGEVIAIALRNNLFIV